MLFPNCQCTDMFANDSSLWINYKWISCRSVWHRQTLKWRWTAENGRTLKLFCYIKLLDFISSVLLNSFLSVIAFLGNALILFALHKESSLPPSKLLLRNLATTDLSVGPISQPFALIYRWMSVANEYWNIRLTHRL